MSFDFCQVVDIMKVNVDKVLERDAKLSELDSRAGREGSMVCYYLCAFKLVYRAIFFVTLVSL